MEFINLVLKVLLYISILASVPILIFYIIERLEDKGIISTYAAMPSIIGFLLSTTWAISCLVYFAQISRQKCLAEGKTNCCSRLGATTYIPAPIFIPRR